MARFLAADLGGTKSSLWLFEQAGAGRETLLEATVASEAYAGAGDVVSAFLAGRGADAAAIAIAGPVVEGRARPPNLPWVVDRDALARLPGLGRVELLNDLAATALGIAEIDDSRFATLNEGRKGGGTIAVIAAGTGLGEAALVADGDRLVAMPSEGGHADFGPGNETEVELLGFLAKRHGHVSWERLVSGPGLCAIHEFLVQSGRGEASAALAARMAAGDPAAAIAEAALSGADPSASAALDIFVRLYGAEAGNLALKVFATGGVYLAGGIAPKILPRLREGPFLQGFLAKGRHADLLAAMPVKVILEQKAALLGAARRAQALVAGADRGGESGRR